MHTGKQDILQDIPDKYLPALKDIFKENWPYAVQPYALIDKLIVWKQKNPSTKARFTCPEGEWQDGTFVAIINESTYKIFFFTLEHSCERLLHCLKETKLIDWNKGPYFCAMHEDLDEIITKFLLPLENIEFVLPSTCWWLPKEKALQFEITYPSDIYIAPLKQKHAVAINSVWPHAYPGSEIYLAKLIAMNGGIGVFLKSDDKLCSWIMTNDFGALATLQTLKEYKRKGYGALLLKLIAKQLASNGSDSIAYIVRKNTVSQLVFNSLGFKLINYVTWIQYRNSSENFKPHL